MTSPANTERYKNHRFPGEIISHGVWLSYRFPLSYRDVQELLFECGITVSHEAIRQWCHKFGQDYAHQLRHRRPRPGDKWHLDEVFLTINSERHYLWCAVDIISSTRGCWILGRAYGCVACVYLTLPSC
jgi:putative transposase